MKPILFSTLGVSFRVVKKIFMKYIFNKEDIFFISDTFPVPFNYILITYLSILEFLF